MKYNDPSEVPNEVLAKRLDDLSDIITSKSNHRDSIISGEMTMRIPAEVDRDCDIVFQEVAKRLRDFQALFDKQAESIDSLGNTIRECMGYLTEMRYFNEEHKMKRLAWNAIHCISPKTADMTPEEAFDYWRDKSSA